MADATKLHQLNIAQWSRPGAESPKLASPVSAEATTLFFNVPLKDKEGNIITGDTLIGIQDRKGYIESVYIPPNKMSESGLSANDVIRGVDLSGLDFSTQNDPTLAVEHNADDIVICQISAVYVQMIVQAIMGGIATGSNNFVLGDGTDSTVTIKQKDGSGTVGILRKAGGKVQFSDNGEDWSDLSTTGAHGNSALIKDHADVASSASDSPSDGDILIYDDGEGKWVNAVVSSAIQNSSSIFGAATGGVDAYEVTFTPAPVEYVEGQVFYFKANSTNTGAATLNVNDLGAITISKRGGLDLKEGDILEDQFVQVIYTGGKFEIISPIGTSAPLFGSGSDGNVTTVGDLSLSRDMYYNNLTVNHTITTNNHRIFCRGTLTINEGKIIQNNGANGSNGGNASGGTSGNGGNGGITGTAGSLPPRVAGSNGGAGGSLATGTAGTAGSNKNKLFHATNGASGGKAHSSSGTVRAGGLGGNGGTGTDTRRNTFGSGVSEYLMAESDGTLFDPAPGAGGGGGGGGNNNVGGNYAGAGGGGGGASGGFVVLYARKLVNNGIIQALGGNGGNGGTSTTGGGGGGGGGGSGGTIITFCHQKSGTGTELVTGGTKGALGTGGGTDGTEAQDGSPGTTVSVILN